MSDNNDEVRSWIFQQAKHHPAFAIWDSMQRAGWPRLQSARVIKEVLTVDLLDDGEDTALNEHTPSAATIYPYINLTGKPNYIDAGDIQVPVLAVCERPQIVVFGDVLSAQECEEIIEAARPRMRRSTVIDHESGGSKVNEVRTSNGMFFKREENELIARLEKRIEKLVNWPLLKGEDLQVLQYAPGAQYKPHYDYFDPKTPSTAKILQRGGQRLGTFLIYLKEPARGGGTIFPDVGFEAMPRRGNGVFFSYPCAHESSKSLHGGSPVEEGEKWVATKWLRQENFN